MRPRLDVAKSKLLGRVSDYEVMRIMGTSRSTVRRWRERLGIAAFDRKFHVPKKDLGKMPDVELAARLGCSTNVVAKARRDAGITAVRADLVRVVRTFRTRDKRHDDFRGPIRSDPRGSKRMPDTEARLRQAVRLRERGLTLVAIGAKLGVTKQRVDQMIASVTGRKSRWR